jgi:hypothetical protein
MRWDDLPADVREPVRERLGRLLRDVASQRGRDAERPDEAQ